MKQSTVSDNVSRTGGGLYVNSSYTNLESGAIEYNRCSMLGGGLYFSEIPVIVSMKNTVVHDNEATVLGGGLWCCPTGSGEMKATEGIAFFDNKASRAGDDFVCVNNAYFYEREFPISLSHRMLGGGWVDWYKDGGLRISTSVYGFPDNNVPRYSDEDAESVFLTEYRGQICLKAVTTAHAKERALQQADLIIRHNVGGYGGGIGTDASLKMATDKMDDWHLRVKKSFYGTPDTFRKPAYIQLMINDIGLDFITLSEENNWQADFTNLPDPGTLMDHGHEVPVSVREYADESGTVFKEFTTVYSKLIKDEQHHLMEIDVTNQAIRDISIHKLWPDDTGMVHPELSLMLLANGEKVDPQPQPVAEDNRYTFKDLPRYDPAGNEIQYTVREEPVEGYYTYYLSEQGEEKSAAGDGDLIVNTKENPFLPVTAEISCYKHLIGRDWTEEDTFTFRLTAVGSAPLRLEDEQLYSELTCTTDQSVPDHRAVFPHLLFESRDLDGKESEVFEYRIAEVIPEDTRGIRYDSPKTVRIRVSRDEKRHLHVSYDYNGKWETTLSAPDFHNEYIVQDRKSVHIYAEKQSLGKDGEPDSSAWTATLQLKAGNSQSPMPANSEISINHMNPVAEFGAITYSSPGTYHYTVSEKLPDGLSVYNPLDNKYLYDVSSYAVTVVVEDDGRGKLKEPVVRYFGYVQQQDELASQDIVHETHPSGTDSSSE